MESISFRTLLPLLGPNPSYVILDKSWVTVATMAVEVEAVEAIREAFKNPNLILNALGAIHILCNHFKGRGVVIKSQFKILLTFSTTLT